MKKLIAIVGAGLVLLFLAYYAWPVTGAMRLAAALERGDAAAIAERLDIEAISSSLAREVGRAHLDQSGQQQFAQGEREVAIARAAAQARPLVDDIVTPERLAAFLKDGRIARPAGAPPLALNKSLPTFAALAQRGFLPLLFATDPDGLTRFVIVVDAPGEPLLRYGLIFHLSGLTWRLAELDLPRGLRLQLAAEIPKRS
jgi:hypothetical protein